MGLIENIYHVARGDMALSHIFDGVVVYPAAGALGGCASDTAVQKGSAEPTGALYAEGLSPEMLGQSDKQPDGGAQEVPDASTKNADCNVACDDQMKRIGKRTEFSDEYLDACKEKCETLKKNGRHDCFVDSLESNAKKGKFSLTDTTCWPNCVDLCHGTKIKNPKKALVYEYECLEKCNAAVQSGRYDNFAVCIDKKNKAGDPDIDDCTK
ncbi:MAG: hypothetical protein WC956_06000 [bacterium]